jgi:hypothetical protein
MRLLFTRATQVAVLSLVNVMNVCDEDGGDSDNYLENSIAISLTLVFLLPELKCGVLFSHMRSCEFVAFV